MHRSPRTEPAAAAPAEVVVPASTHQHPLEVQPAAQLLLLLPKFIIYRVTNLTVHENTRRLHCIIR